MFNRGREVETEGARHLNNKISDLKSTFDDPKFNILWSILDAGFPVVPFPRVEECLGMSPRDSSMKI